MNKRSALLALHLGALFFGLSGIFGKLALAAPLVIVFGRASFAVLALFFVAHTSDQKKPLKRQQILALLGIGLLLGAHWWTFFIAVKVAGVAVATLGFTSFPAFTVVLESLCFRERIRRGELLVIGLVCLGLALVTPNFDFGDHATQGLAWGVLSGLLFAVLSVANRAVTRGIKAAQAALWQNLAIVLCCLPLVWPLLPEVRALDWLWIGLLGVLCTGLAHSLFVASLSVLNARTASVVFAMEPVYGIAFAWWLFSEQPGLRLLCGGALIVVATVLSARLNKHADKAEAQLTL